MLLNFTSRIITGIWGLGWGAEGRKRLTLNTVRGRCTCDLSSGRSVRILEGREKIVCRWGTYCSTLLLMLLKLFSYKSPVMLVLQTVYFKRHWSRKGALFSPCRHYHLFHLYSNLLPGSKYRFLKWEIEIIYVSNVYLLRKKWRGKKGLEAFPFFTLYLFCLNAKITQYPIIKHVNLVGQVHVSDHNHFRVSMEYSFLGKLSLQYFGWYPHLILLLEKQIPWT